MAKIRVVAVLEYPVNQSSYKATDAAPIPPLEDCLAIDSGLLKKNELTLGDIEDMGEVIQVEFSIIEDNE